MHTITVKAWIRIFDEHYDALDLDVDFDVDKEDNITIEGFSVDGEKQSIALLRSVDPTLDARIENAILNYAQNLKDDGNAE